MRFELRKTAAAVEIERRKFQFEGSGAMVRNVEGSPPEIAGYGAVFYREGDPGTEYELWGGVVERIGRQAFDSIAEDDVRSFFNHDENIILGRNRSGTLRLQVDDRGLYYVTTPPETDLVRDQVLTPIGRGDVDGASFMFIPRAVEWTTERREVDGKAAEIDVRTITRAETWEVGPVVFPAYHASSSGVRAVGLNADRGAGETSEIVREWQTYRRSLARRDARRRLARMAEIDTAEAGR